MKTVTKAELRKLIIDGYEERIGRPIEPMALEHMKSDKQFLDMIDEIFDYLNSGQFVDGKEYFQTIIKASNFNGRLN